MTSVLIVGGILLLIGPKRAQQIVILGLLAYCFPIHAFVALALLAPFYYFKR